MLYQDYKWDISKFGIILDEEFDTDELEWNDGDLFRLKKVDGVTYLVKLFDNNLMRRDNEV
jgi:hypothetical protein